MVAKEQVFLKRCGTWILAWIIALTGYTQVGEYPLSDSLFMASSLIFLFLMSSLFIISLSTIFFKNYTDRDVNILFAFVFGIIALQAAWPVFMPRISLEDTNQEKGFINADLGIYQVLREAVIRVKPPLIPFSSIITKDYSIANNLNYLEYDDSSPNLLIKDIRDGKNIRIVLLRVTGWSFDEIAGKIRYQADKPLKVTLPENVNISSLDGALNMTSPEDSWIYPDRFDYRHIFFITSDETIPVDIGNLTFSIDNDSKAWKSLKNWTDEGYCSDILISKEWDYRLDKDRSYTYVNDKVSNRINKDTFNSPEISIKVGIIRLAPQEKNKRMDIIFRKRVCIYN